MTTRRSIEGGDRPGIEEYQARVYRLMSRLVKLNFTDLTSAVGWLEHMCQLTRVPGIQVPRHIIVQLYRMHGYNPGYTAQSPMTRDKYARHIIGQALDSLLRGRPIPAQYPQYAQRWRQAFKSPRQT